MRDASAPIFGDARLPERFWSKVIIYPGTDCWLWQRGLSGGYARYKPSGESTGNGHRHAYLILVGEIPERLQLDHRCNDRRCVNPAHLEPVTTRTNVLRGFGRSALNHRAIACVNGHRFTDANTYVTRDGRRQCRECGRARCRAYQRSLKAATEVGIVV